MKEFYTTVEAARLLGDDGSNRVHQEIQSGEIPAFRIEEGKDFGITRSDLIEYMKTHAIVVPDYLSDPEPKVMIVDDETSFTDPLEEILNHHGYKVITANTGVSAGYRLKAFKPHVILLDMGLGDMDGREFMKIVSGDEEMRNVKIIGMSAFVRREDLSSEELSHICDFLNKPFKYDLLLEKLNLAVEKLGPRQISL
ncbi:response regulator [bacterium]|jgi:CheY-like chemotaxis protein|nr:response regulator [bacterium]